MNDFIFFFFFFSSRRRHTRSLRDWSSDVCSSDLAYVLRLGPRAYRNYGGAWRAVDATGVQVRGQLSRGQQVIAWCAGDLDALPSVHKIRNPERFFPALWSVNYARVPV